MIRRAAAGELDAVRAFYDAQGYRGGASPDDLIIVASSNDGAIVGVVRLASEHGVRVLRGMFVDRSRQRRGLGTRMLRFLEPLIADDEICWCLPYGHLAGFYGQIGFREVGAASAPDFLQSRFAQAQAKWGNIIAMRRP